MNYRHIFHAGNFADVFKHLLLIAVMQALQNKDKGCVFIDTHSGIGLYDLESEIAKRNPEYLQGIIPVIQNAELAIPNGIVDIYRKLISDLNPNGPLKYYPGSPFIMSQLLRPQDALILNELHPEDYQLLKRQFHDSRIHIHHRDAYELLPALLPPKLKRGLIFIDPPYEQKNEFTNLLGLIAKSLRLFPQGVFFIWYPIVHDQHHKFLKHIQRLGLERILHTELILSRDFDRQKNGLRGSGVVILNAPYKIEETILPITHWLEKLY